MNKYPPVMNMGGIEGLAWRAAIESKLEKLDPTLQPSDALDAIGPIVHELACVTLPGEEKGFVHSMIEHFHYLTPKDYFGICETIRSYRKVYDEAKDETQPLRKERKAASLEDYFDFFELHLAPKRDVLSGQLMTFYEGRWVPAIGRLEYLKSHALETNQFIMPSHLVPHLERYTAQTKPELLVDIPQWDGEDRIADIVSCLRLSNMSAEVAYQFICDWLSKVFMRLNDPSIQNRMLVFTGGQGIGKDELIKTLTRALGQFTASMALSGKDSDLRLAASHALVANISEFDRMHRTHTSTLKDLITGENWFARKPYARAPEHIVSRCSFVSTCNLKSILRDHTGNRRFIVIELGKIDWSYSRTERDQFQILAQAKHLAEQGFKANEQAEVALKQYLEEQTPDNPTECMIDDFFDCVRANGILPDHEDENGRWATNATLKNVFLEICKEHGLTKLTVQRNLKQSGLGAKKSIGGKESRVYRINPVEPVEKT